MENQTAEKGSQKAEGEGRRDREKQQGKRKQTFVNKEGKSGWREEGKSSKVKHVQVPTPCDACDHV